MSKSSIVKIDYLDPDPADMDRASIVLKEGGFVVAPTETRYGLLARADSQKILKKLFDLKQRPLSMPTAVFVASLEQVSEYAQVTDLARRLNEAFLPGPLTVILKTKQTYEAPLSVDGKMGFRISSAPVIGELLARVGCPLTATSANKSGSVEPETVEDIQQLFGSQVGLYLDAGLLDHPASTVVEATTEIPEILRAGAVAPETLFRVVRKVNS